MITNSLTKTKTWRSEKYLSFVRTRPCVITDSTVDVIAHHIRSLGGGGMGLKPPDFMCVPMTAKEHAILHATGEKSYWLKKGINPVDLITMTMLVYLAQKPSTELIQKLGQIISTP